MSTVISDNSRCAGTAMCVSVAPEYFRLDTSDRRVRVTRSEVDVDDVDDVEEAVDLCPVSALRMV